MTPEERGMIIGALSILQCFCSKRDRCHACPLCDFCTSVNYHRPALEEYLTLFEMYVTKEEIK